MSTEHDASRALDEARELASAAVDAAPDGQAGFEIAERLAHTFREAANYVGSLRGRAAMRIKDEQALSLRGLASHLGVSKSLTGLWAATEQDQQGQEAGDRGTDEREHGAVGTGSG